MSDALRATKEEDDRVQGSGEVGGVRFLKMEDQIG